jgi:diguanylate cyclase (GGDEF)-like protein
MTDLRPSATAWVDLIVLAALAATFGAHQLLPTQDGSWAALALLLVCAAVAHAFPIRPAFDNVTYHLTGAFVLAGAMLLSPVQLAVLATFSIASDLWLRRRMPGVWVLWAFNAAQTTIASLVVLLWLRWAHTRQLETLQDTVVLVVGVALFTFIQALLVGVVVALNSRKSLFSAGTFSRAALLSDFAIGLGGLVVGGLWLVKPMLLLLMPGLVVVLHRATRTAHLAELADRDPKTGLHNARFLERALEAALVRARQHGQPLAVLFADLDHFKQINDRYGHDVGDLVLRGLACVLEDGVNRGDIVARYGGEEFVVLLPGADEGTAMALAEQLRVAVQNHTLELPSGESLACTISIGVALSPVDGDDPATLLRQADAALRQAKTTRNCLARCAETGHARPADVESVPPPSAAGAASSPRLATLVLGLVTGAGALATLFSIAATLVQPESWSAVVPFLMAAVFAEFMSVNVYQARQQRITLSFSVAAVMATIAAVPFAAPLVTLIACFFATTFVMRQREWRKVLFNLANPVLASAAAGTVYSALRPVDSQISIWTVAAGLAAVLVYVAVNLGPLSLMIALHSGRPLVSVLKASGWFAPTKVLLGLTGAFVGGAFAQLGLVVVAMFVLPMLLMRYTLAFYARRSQDTIRMLEDQAATLEQQTDRLEHQALYDALTDLPNRVLLERELDRTLSEPSNPDTALLLLDLDRFKEINDTFGHRHGDLLLQQIGPRLRSALRERDTIARLGGDEFGVILPEANEHEAQRLALALLSAFKAPFTIEGYPIEVGASIGIAASRNDGRDAATLLRVADVAMYVAKHGQLGLAVHRPEHDRYSPERLTLVAELRQALENDALTLFYQPQVDCHTGQVLGAEALLRWEHPTRGMIPPDQFVALAERTGLIRPLTRWVLDRALRQCRAWRDQGYTIRVSVNASMHDVHDAYLPEEVAQVLARWQLPADCLRVELTEGTLMTDATRALDVLERLRAMGVTIAVDDFGSGYSSLAYLSRLPVSELKIDRAFVSDIQAGGHNAAIVRSTIGLGHDLGLEVVAEGAENQASMDLLRRFGCDSVQGYWISRPLSAAAFAAWLASARSSIAQADQLRAA